jgi:hypothetical protein
LPGPVDFALKEDSPMADKTPKRPPKKKQPKKPKTKG